MGLIHVRPLPEHPHLPLSAATCTYHAPFVAQLWRRDRLARQINCRRPRPSGPVEAELRPRAYRPARTRHSRQGRTGFNMAEDSLKAARL